MHRQVTILGQPYQLYVNQWLNEQIDEWLDDLKKDDDIVLIVDGAERSGKSVFGMQLAKMLDDSFDIDRVCMTPDDFKQKIMSAKKGDCVIYDEAFTGLSSKGSLTAVNKILVELMMEMGQKNLKVIIVLPTFFLLEKYVALFRARALFHVYKRRGIRGHWKYYGKRKKKILYLMGKKFLDYNEPRSHRLGRFLNKYVLDEQAYRDKKLNCFEHKERSKVDEKYKFQRDILIYYLNKKLGVKCQTVTNMLYHFNLSVDNAQVSHASTAIEKHVDENLKFKPNEEFISCIRDEINERNCLVKSDKRTRAFLRSIAQHKKMVKKGFIENNLEDVPKLMVDS